MTRPTMRNGGGGGGGGDSGATGETSLEIQVPNRSQANTVGLGLHLRDLILTLRWSFKYLLSQQHCFYAFPLNIACLKIMAG